MQHYVIEISISEALFYATDILYNSTARVDEQWHEFERRYKHYEH